MPLSHPWAQPGLVEDWSDMYHGSPNLDRLIQWKKYALLPIKDGKTRLIICESVRKDFMKIRRWSDETFRMNTVEL